MNKSLYYTIWGIVLTALFSCQRNEILDSVDNDTSNKIGFSLYDSQASTRGTARENDDLAIYNTDKVNVFVYSYDESKSWASIVPGEFSYYFRSKLNDINDNLANPAWGYAPDEPQVRFYPQSKRLACFAYASDLKPLTGTESNENGLSISSPNEGVPTITYTVPTDVAKQPDLIISERVTDRRAGKITLPMKHALTRIGISMIGKGQKVSDVSITGVASRGYVSLDVNGTIGWDLTGAAYHEEYKFGLIKRYVIFSEEPFNPLREDGYLMMIPQKMTDNVKLSFLLNDQPVSVTLNASHFPDWEPGKKITYFIDVTNDEPIITVDFGGNILSNCYIITPSPTSKQELKIPVTRVNQFWGDETYDTTKDGEGAKNRIESNDEWTVSILWYDALDLVSPYGGKAVQLGKATGRGVNDYFSIIVPAGFRLRGNLSVGVAKGDKGPALVDGGTTDRDGNLMAGASAKCIWSWHIWITDYDPYVENPNIINAGETVGKYAEVPDGILWQGVSTTGFYQTSEWVRETLKIIESTGNDVWTGNKRMLMDRPVGVRNKNFACEDYYKGVTTSAVNTDQTNTPYNGNGILYYQFGRKDPFPADIHLYTLKNNVANVPVKYNSTANGEQAPVPVWYTIYNPLRMIYTGTAVDPYNGGGNWSSDEYARSDNGSEDILWADPKTVNNTTAKSLFDPSPWLFRTPRTGAFNSFVTNYSYIAGTTGHKSPNDEGYTTMMRNDMSVPSSMEYVLTENVKVKFWSWGSRFWKTGLWNDAQGFNGQYWMSATVVGWNGWDYYLLISPQDKYTETNPSKPSSLSGQSDSVRMNPQSPGIRASTMALIPIQNQLPSDPSVSLMTWSYNYVW